MTSRHRQPWTAEEDEQLRQLDGAGFSVADIAVQLDRTVGAVLQRKTGLGVTRGSETCLFCGAELQQPARGRRKRYCGVACASKARRRTMRPIVCAQCAGPIPAERFRARLYCSEQCKQRAWYERKKARGTS